jgi:signal transduction histidine kinase
MPPPADNPAMTPLKILIVEDRETDTELIVRELKKHGFAPSWIRVDTEEDFLRQIHTPLDLISVDAIMPQFSAHRVLTLLQEHQLDTPCIIISGSIGEEEAVSLIRAGASDYLMKDRLGRLGQSIRQILDQHRLRREHTRAHNALITLNEELERRIAERTARLEELNHDLAEELLERKQIEQQLREHETALERRVAARTVQLERSYVRLRRLASELTLAEQRERKNLASELHDYLAQLLVVSKFKIAQLRRNPSDNNLRSLLQEVDSSLDQALTYSRTLIAHLSPTVLFIQGLVAALHWLPEYFSKQGLQVQVKSHVSTVTLSEDRSILLFQSVRELLFNALKHAGTGEATVEIRVVDERVLRITVADGGTGFDGEMLNGDTKGFGLFSIRERIEGLDGTFSVVSSPGAGTRIELSIPLADIVVPPEMPGEVLETDDLSIEHAES